MIVFTPAVRIPDGKKLIIVPFGDVHYNCVAPTHKVLTRTLIWKEVQDLSVGEVLIGFDEQPRPGRNKSRRLQETTVLANHRAMRQCVDVTLAGGQHIICTVDHPWLVRHHGLEWRRAEQLSSANSAPRCLPVWQQDTSHDTGWLAGFFDGEGCLSYNKAKNILTLSASQKPGVVLDKALAITRRLGFRVRCYDHTSGVKVMRILGGWSEILRFLGVVRPVRLLPKIPLATMNIRRGTSHVKIVSVTPIGLHSVCVMGTSSATYFAEGFPMHNTRDCDKPRFHRLISWVLEREAQGDVVRMIGLGDYTDPLSTSERAALRGMKGGDGVHDTTRELLDDVCAEMAHKIGEVLMPVRHTIWGLIEGHHFMEFMTHEVGVLGETGTEFLCKMLGTRYLGDVALGHVTLSHQQTLEIAVYHGKGSPGLATRKKLGAAFPQTEIVFSGHSHDKIVGCDQGLVYDASVPERVAAVKRYYVGTGSFLRGYAPGRAHGSYVEKGLMQPCELGVAVVEVKLEKRGGVWRKDYHVSI